MSNEIWKDSVTSLEDHHHANGEKIFTVTDFKAAKLSHLIKFSAFH